MLNFPADDMVRMLSALIPLACKDATRQHISCILFTSHEGAPRFVATDGHRMGVWTHGAKLDCTLVDFQLSLDDSKRLLKTLKSLDKRARAACSVSFVLGQSGPEFAVTHANGDRMAYVTVKLVTDSHFPPYQQVIPSARATADRPTRWVSVDPRLLAEIADAFASASYSRTPDMCIIPGDERDPILFRSVSCELMCVLMPQRANEPADLVVEKSAA